ncbi:MAG: hypothetical protein CMO81_04690 [Waddliaceae bacterium]|nr:hypothetical protein [Waddliaceae bacterium]
MASGKQTHHREIVFGLKNPRTKTELRVLGAIVIVGTSAALIAYPILLLTLFFLFIVSTLYLWKQWKKRGVYLNAIGVAYRDSMFEVLIPWRNLDRNESVYLDSEGRLHFKLLNPQAGIGYMVTKSKLDVSDDWGTLPFHLENNEFILEKTLKVPLEHLINVIQELRAKVDEVIGPEADPNDQSGCVDFCRSELTKNLVAVRKGSKIQFPSFCPINGKDCSEAQLLKFINDYNTVEWFLSRSGKSLLRWASVYRFSSMMLAFWVYLAIGACVFYSWMNPFWTAIDLILIGTLSLSVFSFPALVWYATRDKIRLFDHDDQIFIVQIENPEYLQAFVDLNR